MFAITKYFTIFVLPTHIVSSVNHRIYRILNTHRRSFLYSYCTTAISGFGDSEKATLSLYPILTKIKFFTNAKPSKKFSTAEREYAATNALPSDRAQTIQLNQSTEKKELRKATLLPAIGLLFREFYRDVRCLPAQVAQNCIQRLWHRDTIRTDQWQGFLCQRTDLCTGISVPNGANPPVSAKGSLYGHCLNFIFVFI